MNLNPELLHPLCRIWLVPWPNICIAWAELTLVAAAVAVAIAAATSVFAGLILPARILANGAVSILAAVTTPFASVVRVTGTAIPKMVVQPSAGMGSKDAAKRCAMKVNRLFATAGAGEVLPLNSACCCAMKMPDAAYDLR